ncbi:MAG: hypothetical protein ABIP30_07675 [Ferruginibacter sp.]
MENNKIWKSDEKGDDRIIAYGNETIYKGNPKFSEIDNCIFQLQNTKDSPPSLFAIPLRYIAGIKMQESKKYIEVLFKGDTEHLRINNDRSRKAVFDYFKETIPGATYSLIKYSKLKAGKKPLIAMAVITVIFLYTLYYAIGYDEGNQYDITNGHYNSITGIALSIASYGVEKTVIIFVLLLAIAIFSFVRKVSDPPVIEQLIIKH